MVITLDNLREQLSHDVFAQINLACRRFDSNPGALEPLAAVEGLHRGGENMLAFVLANTALEYLDDKGIQPVWLQGLHIQLAKVLHAMGSYQAAIVKLQSLLANAHAFQRAEILGNLASIYKTMALEAHDEIQREQWLEESYCYYVQCFEVDDLANNFWLGVNALAIAAARYHDDVVQQYWPAMVNVCQQHLDQHPKDFWAMATLAELGLIGKLCGMSHALAEQFLEWYSSAQQYCHSVAQRKSARKNLPLLLQRLRQQSPSEADNLQQHIDLALPPLKVACFTGHRIDVSNRHPPRFPASQVALVGKAIERQLVEQGIEMGFSSLSNGGDLLFADALLEHGGILQAVLPFEPFQFLAESVSTGGADDAHWQQRYTHLMEDRSGQILLWYAGRGVIDPVHASTYYEHANRVIYGLAQLRAKELGAKLVPMALLNQRETGSEVGAKHTVDVWRSKGHEVLVLDPIDTSWQALPPDHQLNIIEQADTDTVIRTMLFADFKGFSRFNDQQIQVFCEEILPLVKQQLASLYAHIDELNTWGDGLFVVLDTPSNGAEAALRLCELMAQPNMQVLWRGAAMDGHPAIRVSLHSAPVQRMQNPLTQQLTHWGSNINIAARIEPVTPVNQVYASVATSALLAYEGVEDYRADFVGVVPLAKAFGAQEIFRIRRC